MIFTLFQMFQYVQRQYQYISCNNRINLRKMDGQNKFCTKKCQELVEEYFTSSALPSLVDYIRIENLSRAFDKQWATNGLLEKAAEHIRKWAEQFEVTGLTSQIIKLEGLSPIIFTEVKGDTEQTLFFYGHYDKQPPFSGWNQGLGPFTPVIKDDKLYGRGGADDGYSTYGTLIAIKALQKQGLKVPRCVMITQGDEESGSAHIGPYIQKLKERIGNPTLFFCLDSGTLDYERVWITNSLRGIVAGTLRVDVLTEGIHSGDASGIVPSSFRIIRQLLNRLENAETGEVNEIFNVDIPPLRYEQMHNLVTTKGQQAIKEFPIMKGLHRAHKNILTSIITRGWKPQMAVIGSSGLPECERAGNVMLPFSEVRISLRIPPTKNPKQAEKQFVNLLTENPPYNSKVTLSNVVSASGFNAPQYSENLQKSIKEASETYYGNQMLALSQGMSIPFLGMLRDLWPKGQFIVTGVLGPQSNAHGPNEFLHIPYVKKLICSIAHIIARR